MSNCYGLCIRHWYAIPSWIVKFHLIVLFRFHIGAIRLVEVRSYVCWHIMV